MFISIAVRYQRGHMFTFSVVFVRRLFSKLAFRNHGSGAYSFT